MKIIKDFDLLSPKWLDIAFEKKNKQYGAYELRNNSSNRHLKALIIVFILGLAGIFLPKIVSSIEWREPDITQDGGIEVTEYNEPDKPEEKPDVQIDDVPPPPLKEAVQVTQIQVANDDEVDVEKMKTQDELAKSDVDIASKTVEGTPDGQVSYDDVKKQEVIVEKEDIIVDFVDVKPEFYGGDKALMKWLNDNINYPYAAIEGQIQGKVFVNFVVRTDGAISDVKVIKGVHPTLDREAERLVKAMPRWKPGQKQGTTVSSRFTLPVTFILR